MAPPTCIDRRYLSAAPKRGGCGGKNLRRVWGMHDKPTLFLTLAAALDHPLNEGGYTVPVAEIVNY